MNPATAAATVPLDEPKVVRSSFHGLSAVLVFPPGELAHRHLSHEHGARGLELLDDRAVPVRNVVREDS